MAEYASTATVGQVAGRLLRARRVLLTTHTKPDGDGFGAALALWRALRGRGTAADIYLMGPLESRLKEIAGDTPYLLDRGRPPDDSYDLVVVLDTGSWSQLDPIAGWLRQRPGAVVGVDHHVKGDDVAPMRLVDPTAASTTQMLVPLLEEMGCAITEGRGGIAEAIFVGLATDTGWFRYSNADARAIRLAADLLERGVDKSRLYQVIEETFRPQRLALAARALSSLEYALEGTVAIMSLRRGDFSETGGRLDDVSELVNTPMSVRQVRASVLLAETGPGKTKLSFRSKPDTSGSGDGAPMDMNVLAQHFGGGGHVHAAGANVEMRLDDAKSILYERLAPDR